MSSKLRSIEERLHKRADNELAEAVERTIKSMTAALSGICPNHHPMHTEIMIRESGENQDEVKKGYNFVLRQLSDAFIAKVRDSYRETVVKAFMEKVDTLHDQIDELREEINYHDHD